MNTVLKESFYSNTVKGYIPSIRGNTNKDYILQGSPIERYRDKEK